MADKETCDQFANELARRFEELTAWAVKHWPHGGTPLLASDFSESRKEMGRILGAKLSEAREDLSTASSKTDSSQYVQTTPAPWP